MRLLDVLFRRIQPPESGRAPEDARVDRLEHQADEAVALANREIRVRDRIRLEAMQADHRASGR